MSNDGQLSEDGQWRWDAQANEWTPVQDGSEQDPGQGASGQHTIADGQLSDDGQWRWDAQANEWRAAAVEAPEVTEERVAAMMDAAAQQPAEQQV
jgi:hypothetical protein